VDLDTAELVLLAPVARVEPGVRGSSEGDGAGLGLALARRLARSVRGDVEAAPGEGGRFLVRLPTA